MTDCWNHKIFQASRWFTFLAALLVAACGPARVSLRVGQTINPDIHGRPSPVVLRMYELKSLTAFNAADFFSLNDKDKEILGPDLLVRDEFFLRPGDKQEFKRKLQDGTRYVGVIAAFRDLEHAQWRSVVAVTPGRTTTLIVRVDGQKVSVATK